MACESGPQAIPDLTSRTKDMGRLSAKCSAFRNDRASISAFRTKYKGRGKIHESPKFLTARKRSAFRNAHDPPSNIHYKTNDSSS